MKFLWRMGIVVFGVLLLVDTTAANIVFGSKNAGFSVSNSSTLNLGTAALRQGTLLSTGGTLASSSTMNCSEVVIGYDVGTTHKTMTVDGAVVLTGSPAIILGDNQKLLVEGGVVSLPVTVNGADASPSIIEGFGQFASDITINSGKQVNMRWTNGLNVNIKSSSASIIKLEQDLAFEVGKCFSAIDSSYSVSINFNGYRVFVGGDEASSTIISDPQVWSDANIVLMGPVTLASVSTVSQSIAGGYFNGRGNSLTFESAAVLDNAGYPVSLVDIILRDVTASSLVGAGTWNLLNTTFESTTNSITVDGSIISDTVDLFSGATTFGASRIKLNRSISFPSNWRFESPSTINGGGAVWYMNAGKIILDCETMSFTDITLANVLSDSFDASNAQTLILSNVNWLTPSYGSIRINGLPGSDSGAGLVLDSSPSSGNIFTSPTAWEHAVIELLEDTTLATTWTINEDTVIDGGGCRFIITEGTFSVASGKRLYLRNMILDGVVNSSLADVAGGFVDFSNVTMKINENIDWSIYYTSLAVNGPLSLIIGDHSIAMPHINASSVINGMTVYYDTLSGTDSSGVYGFSGSGRTLYVTNDMVTEVTIYEETSSVVGNLSEVPGGDSFSILFDTSRTYDGEGRVATFSQDSSVAVTVNAGVDAVVVNSIFDRLLPSQLDVDNTGSLYFSNNTIIRLSQDWAGDQELTYALSFGNGGGSAASMVLDLNGFMIDMNNTDAALILDSGAGSTLRICNGRILNLSGTKLLAGNSTKIILENVELGLSGDYTFSGAALDIEGHCVLSGTAIAQFLFDSGNNFTIKSMSSFTVSDQLVYCHDNEGTNNFVFADSTATLALVRSTFKRSNTATTDKLVLATGRLLVDSTAILNVGSRGIQFGNGSAELNVDFRPGATLTIDGSGGLVYRQNT
jgi:hypothetical protein